MWNYYAGQNVAYDSDPSQEIAASNLPMDSVSDKDVGIVVFSRVTGEGGDAVTGYYKLHKEEINFFQAVEAVCDKVIVIINSPSPIAIQVLKTDNKVGAILQIGGLGARGDIKVNVRGGKLLGFGNACPYNERGYLTDITDTYYGEALAIIKPEGAAVNI